ncbi:MAG TPA: hypothetical protein PLH94_09090 [Fimbriimonadaceae bacterium]|nr:hypothetical protein [Fimbriimonadaceae bacterium]
MNGLRPRAALALGFRAVAVATWLDTGNVARTARYLTSVVPEAAGVQSLAVAAGLALGTALWFGAGLFTRLLMVRSETYSVVAFALVGSLIVGNRTLALIASLGYEGDPAWLAYIDWSHGTSYSVVALCLGIVLLVAAPFVADLLGADRTVDEEEENGLDKGSR